MSRWTPGHKPVSAVQQSDGSYVVLYQRPFMDDVSRHLDADEFQRLARLRSIPVLEPHSTELPQTLATPRVQQWLRDINRFGDDAA